MKSALEIANSVYVNPQLAVENASSTVFDNAAPTTGTMECPPSINGPLTLSYANAGDTGGSGLKTVTLWYKKEGDAAWTNTGQTRMASSGTFGFSPSAEGRYYFAIQAEDNAGNTSPAPADSGMVSAAYDKTPPVIALIGESRVTVSQGASYVDEGATASDAIDGDLSASIVATNAVNTAVAGQYTVTYTVSDIAGNAAVAVVRQVIVTTAYRLTLLSPSHGEVTASPAPDADNRYAPGTAVTLTYVPQTESGYSLVSWSGAVQDATNPNQARVVMNADATVSAVLARDAGSVAVSVSPDTARWTVTDADSVSHAGTGSTTLTNVATGAVTIAYSPVTGYVTPPAEAAFLAKDATVTFQATYAPSEEGLIVSIPTTLTAAPSAVVSCPVTLNNAAGITSFSVTVRFDNAKIDCTGASNGALVSRWGGVQVDKGANYVTVSGAGQALAAGGGVLASLQLRILPSAAAGVTPLTLSSVSLNRNALKVATHDGSLTIEGAAGQFTWGDVDGDSLATAQDATYVLQRRVGLIAQLPVAQLSGKPDDLGGGNVSARTPAVVGAYDAALILKHAAGTLASFPADVNKNGKGPDVGAQPPASPDPSAPKRVVTITGALALRANADLQVPIQIDNAEAVAGYYAEIAYDPAQIEFVGFNKGLLTDAWPVPVANVQNGVLRLAGAGAQPIQGSGVLAVLTFRALATAGAGETATLRFTVAELNDGLILAEARATEAVPTLAQLAPARGSAVGGTLVTITGANLAGVTSVAFGAASAPWFRVLPGGNGIVALTPQGNGAVSVQAVAANGTATLRDAFTYFVPDVQLSLRPQGVVKAGSVLDIPVFVEIPMGAKPATIQFVLNYDPTRFTTPSARAAAAAALGNAATGKTISSSVVRPGELLVVIKGGQSAAAAMQPGLLCTLQLVATGGKSTSESILYISEVKSATAAAKSLEGDANSAPAMAAQ